MFWKITLFSLILLRASIILPKNESGIVRLEIAILSARENFLKRQSIRETWLKEIDRINQEYSGQISIRAHFVVGTESCRHHPINRQNPYACDRKESVELDHENERIWRRKLEIVDAQIVQESRQFDDLFIVAMIDVYRSLAHKLLIFVEQIVKTRQGITHLLKTDDDCYVNVEELARMVLESQNQKFSWFGNFRTNWPVNRYGKWEDTMYSAFVYPEFACGSGYVLTRDVLDWLVMNSRFLQRYQGEDVSMGIWLEPIGVTKIRDKRFICGEEEWGSGNFLAAPQLTPELMKRTHEKLMPR